MHKVLFIGLKTLQLPVQLILSGTERSYGDNGHLSIHIFIALDGFGTESAVPRSLLLAFAIRSHKSVENKCALGRSGGGMSSPLLFSLLHPRSPSDPLLRVFSGGGERKKKRPHCARKQPALMTLKWRPRRPAVHYSIAFASSGSERRPDDGLRKMRPGSCFTPVPPRPPECFGFRKELPAKTARCRVVESRGRAWERRNTMTLQVPEPYQEKKKKNTHTYIYTHMSSYPCLSPICSLGKTGVRKRCQRKFRGER